MSKSANYINGTRQVYNTSVLAPYESLIVIGIFYIDGDIQLSFNFTIFKEQYKSSNYIEIVD